MTDLVDLVEPLKRVVATPGTFVSYYPEATDDDLAMQLLDGFAECQLDGFFLSPLYSATDDGLVTPDLTRAETALVVLYSGARYVRAELLHRNVTTHYEAGGAVYEVAQGTTVLVEVLKEIDGKKKEVLERLRLLGTADAFYMADLYMAKAIGREYVGSYAGSYAGSMAWLG